MILFGDANGSLDIDDWAMWMRMPFDADLSVPQGTIGFDYTAFPINRAHTTLGTNKGHAETGIEKAHALARDHA